MTHTADLDDAFFPRLLDVAACLEADPLDLLGCWYSESQLFATAHNPGGDASGIFQAMPATLKGLGFPGTHADFRRLSATEQLTWAERYYAPHRGQLVSPGAVYLCTFLPAYMAHAREPLFVLCSAHLHPEWYAPNRAAFDPEGKGYITVGDLSARIARVTHGPRWDEIVSRLSEAREAPLPAA